MSTTCGTASIPGVTFQPWRGEKYKTRKPRVLVLGESHYHRGKMPRRQMLRFTQEWIASVISGEKITASQKRTFTKLVAACIGRRPREGDKKRFFNEVAFYNYIQTFLPRQRAKLSSKYWTGCDDSFEAVVQELRRL